MRKLESMATSRLKQGTGNEGCQRLEQPNCKGRPTRFYGEMLPDNAFTGWRGPFCSAKCYKLSYPLEKV